GDEAVHGRNVEGFLEIARPIDFYPVDFRCGSQPKMETQVAAGEIAGTAANFLHPFLVPGEYRDGGADAIPIGARTHGADSNPVVFVHRLVDQQQGSSARIIDCNRYAALIPKITDGQTAAGFGHGTARSRSLA